MATELTIQEEVLAANLRISSKTFMELREIFDLVDLDHGGSIQASELSELMKTLGMNDCERIVTKMMNEFGKDDIDFESFCKSMCKKSDIYQDKEEIRAAFFYLFGKHNTTVKSIVNILQQYVSDPKLLEVVKSVIPGEKLNVLQFLDKSLDSFSS
eukprot:NODE_336_length_10675_cov_0.185136.p6 type:complete len:156 gc:universal NODE_336_length_10675_cov_0.185136:9612-10079(+)